MEWSTAVIIDITAIMARYNRIASFALPVPAKAKGHISNKETNNSFFMVLPFSGDSIWALVYIRIFTSHQFTLFLSNFSQLKAIG